MARRYIFGAVEDKRMLPEICLAALRVYAGLALALGHGLAKLPVSESFVASVSALGFPMPLTFAWAAAGAEFFGGLLLALGLFSRPAAFFIACTMAVAAFGQHGSDAFAQKELALLYLFVSFVYVVRGGGRYSVDSKISSRR